MQTLALDGINVVQGEWWRLWSAHLTHYSMSHAAVNALVLFFAGGIVEIRMGTRWLATRLLVVAPLLSIALLLWSPDLVEYRGLSAVCVCLTVVAMISVARDSHQAFAVIALLAIALLLKLIGDAQGASMDLANLPQGVILDWRSHVLGALAGVAIAVQSGLSPNRQIAAASPRRQPSR